jgi:hypothetical protein
VGADRPSGPAAEPARTLPRGTTRPTPSVVVLVEGASDAAAVRVLCAGRGLDRGRVEVRDLGGVTNVGHHLRGLAAGTTVLGLYDAPEERFVVRGLRSAGRGASGEVTDDLAAHGFWMCDRDLEDELIRALGPERVTQVLEELGELERFRAFQRQPQWRGRAVHDQLHRFAGTASGRKLLLARRLAEELTPASTPAPLTHLVEAIVRSMAP